jgi:hypothetical protein
VKCHRLLLGSLVAAGAALAVAACSTNDNTHTPSSPCAVTVGVALSIDVNVAGTTGSIPVTSSCSWTAAASASFITITSGTSGSGNGTVSYSIAGNTGVSRTASIVIGTAIVNFFQSGPRAPVDCTVTLSSATAKINSNGGSVLINVTAAPTCQWGFASNSPFLFFPPAGAGPQTNPVTGNGGVVITASANSGPSRTGTVTIGGQTVTVTQDGSI